MQIRISFRSRSDLVPDADHVLHFYPISFCRRASRFVVFFSHKSGASLFFALFAYKCRCSYVLPCGQTKENSGWMRKKVVYTTTIESVESRNPPFSFFRVSSLYGVYPSFRNSGGYPFPLFSQGDVMHHHMPFCSATSGSGNRRGEGGCQQWWCILRK